MGYVSVVNLRVRNARKNVYDLYTYIAYKHPEHNFPRIRTVQACCKEMHLTVRGREEGFLNRRFLREGNVDTTGLNCYITVTLYNSTYI